MTNDKDKVRLLPCANCGGRAALSTYKKRIGTACRHTVIRQHAVCKVCGTQTRVFKALGRAAPAWNKRQPTQSDALREALERIVARCEAFESINLVGRSTKAKEAGTLRHVLQDARAALQEQSK